MRDVEIRTRDTEELIVKIPVETETDMPKPNLEPPKHWSFKALRKDVDLTRILREAEDEDARGIVIDLPGTVLVGFRIDAFEVEWQERLRQNPVKFWAGEKDDDRWLMVVDPLGCPNDAAERLREFLADYDAQMAKRYRVTVQVFT